MTCPRCVFIWELQNWPEDGLAWCPHCHYEWWVGTLKRGSTNG